MNLREILLLRACFGCLSSRSRHHSTRSQGCLSQSLGSTTWENDKPLGLWSKVDFKFLIHTILCSPFFKSTLKLRIEHLIVSLKLIVIAQVMFVVSKRIRDYNHRCFHTMRFFTKQFCPNVMKGLKWPLQEYDTA